MKTTTEGLRDRIEALRYRVGETIARFGIEVARGWPGLIGRTPVIGSWPDGQWPHMARYLGLVTCPDAADVLRGFVGTGDHDCSKCEVYAAHLADKHAPPPPPPEGLSEALAARRKGPQFTDAEIPF